VTLLEVRDVGISFGGVVALSGVSFEAERGKIFAVIGPNGAGKTTLFNIISGSYRADSGRVSLGGEEITHLLPHLRAERGLQRTFQNLQIFEEMTALENVVVGNHLRQRTGFPAALLGLPSVKRETRAAEGRARELLAMLGLSDVGDARAGDLAYGQQKRLEIARALAADPLLLLLDEPAAGLNPAETAALGEIIVGIRDSGVGILLVEHDMRLVMDVSDELMVLNFGCPIARGTPDSVAKDEAVIEAYLGTEVD
jgi:branched-chain amino acid transport system ATP-binding protein